MESKDEWREFCLKTLHEHPELRKELREIVDLAVIGHELSSPPEGGRPYLRHWMEWAGKEGK